MPSFCFTCTIPLELKEPVTGILLLHGMDGSEEVEAGTEVIIDAYFAKPSTRDACAAAAEQFCPESVTRRYTVENQDWNAEWRKTMQPVLVAPRVWVSPVWLAPPLKKDDLWIKIEPKMAFGTGHHETTRLAARAVLAEAEKGGSSSMLDIGTGSGVLCFIGGFFGIGRCTGIENDLVCRENLAENREANHLKDRADFIIGGIECLKKVAGFDLVVMNMIFPQSAPLLPAISSTHLAPGGRLIWSGILAEGKNEAIDAASEAGFSLVNDTTEGEWWCGTFNRISA